MNQGGQRRVAIVTGVSHRAGIGFAIAAELLADGWSVLAHGWSAGDRAHDGNDPSEIDATLDALGGTGDRLTYLDADLSEPQAASNIVHGALDAFGQVDALVINHATSSTGDLFRVTAEELDHAWTVNARATVLLVKVFAEQRAPATPGAVVLFTSGQHLGPMGDELAYAISKGAIHQMTASLAGTLGPRHITVNAVNPGPTDTGWPTPELRDQLAGAFPAGRMGRPADIAPVVSWLVSDAARWVTGQTINAEGGFRR
jgi:3-oxoacyl-[acyl-carrier protein] reductase